MTLQEVEVNLHIFNVDQESCISDKFTKNICFTPANNIIIALNTIFKYFNRK